jgi:hypothetical protein
VDALSTPDILAIVSFNGEGGGRIGGKGPWREVDENLLTDVYAIADTDKENTQWCGSIPLSTIQRFNGKKLNDIVSTTHTHTHTNAHIHTHAHTHTHRVSMTQHSES